MAHKWQSQLKRKIANPTNIFDYPTFKFVGKKLNGFKRTSHLYLLTYLMCYGIITSQAFEQ